nr:tetratricopeptide repeat protein [Neisseria zoodegmatis]
MMMNFKFTVPLFGTFLLGACVSMTPPAPAPDDKQSKNNAIPYPEPDAQVQIDSLGIKVARLEKEVESLKTRVRQLERRSAVRRSTQNRSSGNQANAVAAEPTRSAAQSSQYEQALKQYKSGNYAAAVALLKGVDGGGNGGDTDRQSMYLLMQSHQNLGNCESVINIGNRFATRFRNSSQAAEALFSVGSCQYRMQQQDIARDTWRKLIQIYPDSASAKRAYGELKKR